MAYGSRAGSTAEIAEFVGSYLSAAGISVDVREVGRLDDLDLARYGRVILGSPIRYDRCLPEVVSFVQSNREHFQRIRVALFFTCLALAKPTERARRSADRYAEQLAELLPGVQVQDVGRFAGVLDSSRLSLLPRLFLRVLSVFNGVGEGDHRDGAAIEDWCRKIR